MINYLGKEPSRRVFLMGPPGSFRQENAVAIAEHFNWKCITTGDLLRKEVKSKTPEGKIINQRFKAYEFVDDQLVIDIVHKKLRNAKITVIVGFAKVSQEPMLKRYLFKTWEFFQICFCN